jgi:cobalt-zinc-cadmium efflux system membrane fusion protein
MKVIDDRDLQLHFYVYQENVGRLKKGQLIDIYTADDPDNVYMATISSIGKAIDTETKSINCIAIPEDKLRKAFIDGMYFQVEVKTDTVTAPALPVTAVIKTGDRQYVLVKEKDEENRMYFRKTAVNTGVTSDGFIEIKGDKPLNDVLIKGAYYFHAK